MLFFFAFFGEFFSSKLFVQRVAEDMYYIEKDPELINPTKAAPDTDADADADTPQMEGG